MRLVSLVKRWAARGAQAVGVAVRWLLHPSNSAIVLAVILAAALALRLVGLDWDKGNGIHPDERFLRMVLNDIRWPKSIAEYFNTAQSPLNPRNKNFTFWVYGELPLFLVHRLGDLLHKSGYGQIHLVGRAASALIDVGSVIVIYLLGKRLYSKKVGLVAAGLLAFTVLDIQLSHFFAVDTFAAFFATLGLLCAVYAAEQGRWWQFFVLGVVVGAAMASKISMALFGAVAGLAWLMYALRTRRDEVWAERAILRLGLLGLGVLLAFRVFQPYAFSGPSFLNFTLSPDFLANMKEAQMYQTGKADPPWGFQWANRTPYIFPLYNMVLFGMGVPMALAAFVGWAAGGWEMLSKKRMAHLLPWAWVTLLFVYQGGQFVKSMRYFIPIYPAMALLAAFGIAWVYREARNRGAWARRAAAAVGVLVVLGTAVYGVAFAGIYTRPHPRMAASAWIYENVPMAATLHYRAADGTIRQYQLGIPHGQILAPAMQPVYVSFSLPESGDIVDVTLNHLRSDGTAPSTLRVELAREMWPEDTLVSAELSGVFAPDADGKGRAYRLEMSGLTMAPGVRYVAKFSVADGASLIAESSTILQETYDDPKVPFSEVGRDPFRNYNIPELRVYDDESPDKLRHFQEMLTQADYICFTSQRGYGSIPRMAARFPMATKFYDLLFAGQLGFKLVGEFTSYPQLDGLVFNDDKSEEAFTVYDHAKVLLFQKVEPITAEQIAAAIAPADWRAIPHYTAREAAKYKTLLLTPEDLAIQQQGGTWREIFNPDSWVNRMPTLVWLLLVELLGVLGFLIGFPLFRNMIDRGYALSKTFGILLLVFVSWILVALRVAWFTRLTIGIALLLLALAAGAVAYVERRSLRQFLRERWRHLVAVEGIFLVLFFAWLLIRWGNPDLWHNYLGGEKPMEFAYLNAVIKSTTFPPYDPWFAGGYLNYYYWGQVIVATLIKFTGIVPWVGFNLAVPLLAALTGVGAFTVTYHLLPERVRGALGTRIQGWLYGLVGVAFVVFFGNLGNMNLIVGGLIRLGTPDFKSSIPGLTPVVRALTGLWKVLSGASLGFAREWWFWNATRTIPDTVNEFPFFTFLFADLHAHLIALPFTLLALGMAVNIVRGARAGAEASRPVPNASILARLWGLARDWDLGVLVGLALVVGALWPTNTWDFPTYFVVGVGALLIRGYAREGRIAWQWLLKVAAQAVFVAALAVALFYPFHAYYGSYYTSVELWKGQRTRVVEFLTISGLWLFILFAYMLDKGFGRGAGGVMGWIGRMAVRRGQAARRWALTQALSPTFAGWWTGLVMTVVALAMAAYLLMQLKYPVVAFLLLPLGVALALFFRKRAAPEERFVALLILGGLALSMAVEIVVLKGDIGRMNTVFKFYLQVWVMWAIAAAVALAHLAERSRNWARGWQKFLWGGVAFLVAMSLLYTVTATPARIGLRYDASLGPSLDGMAYMDSPKAQYWENERVLDLKWDKEGILWLLANVDGSPVILEGQTGEYHWGSRVSIYTGLANVVGWRWHQVQQRMLMPGGTVEGRADDVRTIYTTADDEMALALLKKYGVSFIYVGQLERALYGEEGPAKFDRWVKQGILELVFSSQEVKIYRMVK